VVQDLHLRGEALAGLEGVVGLDHHAVSNAGHVVLGQTLDKREQKIYYLACLIE